MPPGPTGRGRGPATFPAQQRPPGDPALIARGKRSTTSTAAPATAPTCAAATWAAPTCSDRRSSLNDQDGELILPVVQNGRMNPGMPVMPPLPLPPDDVKAVAEYIHSVAGDDARAGLRRRPDRPSS